jgi:hypothetical protein
MKLRNFAGFRPFSTILQNLPYEMKRQRPYPSFFQYHQSLRDGALNLLPSFHLKDVVSSPRDSFHDPFGTKGMTRIASDALCVRIFATSSEDWATYFQTTQTLTRSLFHIGQSLLRHYTGYTDFGDVEFHTLPLDQRFVYPAVKRMHNGSQLQD